MSRSMVVMTSCLVASAAWADPPPAAAPTAAASLREAMADLSSNDLAKMQRALPVLGTSRSGAAAGAIAAFIRRGPPGALLVPAIDALGALGRHEAQDTLIGLLRHLRPEVRARAAVALGPIRSGRVSRALTVALGDREATVREAAARSLATAGLREAVEPLVLAIERGNDAAAAAVGALGDASHAEKLTALVGRVPLRVLLPGVRLFLTRRDVPERAKLAIVDRLGELATAEVRTFLQSVAGELPPAQARLREHVTAVAGGISG